MPYRLALDAELDLDNLYLEGFDRFGQRNADSYSDRIVRALDLLGDNPRMARERLEFDPPIRAHSVGAHVVLYRIEGDGIVVLRIRHGREDWQGEQAD